MISTRPTFFCFVGFGKTRLQILPHRPFKSLLANKLSQSSIIFIKNMSNSSNGKVELSESEWQARLSPEQFRILRQKGTEPAFSGLYDKHFEKGVYNCAGCDTPLFTSSTKFKSGCGWPAFFDSIEGAVKRTDDFSFGMRRTEITCAKCGGHLGHVFRGEGYPTPTDERHCVNSVSIKFKEQ